MTLHSHIYLHGFGARYDLPIPLSIYLYAAAGVVLISFVLVVVFAGSDTGERAVRYRRWAVPWLVGPANSIGLRVAGGLVGVASLCTVVITGLFGAPDAVRNPSAYVVWIYLWVALVVICALFGNLWTYLNPFAALYDALHLGRLSRGRTRVLPERLGIWPAAVTFLAIAWLELASGKASDPRVVGALALAYTLYALIGMVAFGRDTWLNRCEAYTVLFGIASRFGPIEVEREESGRAKAVYVRLWGTGLLQPARASWDWITFVILMLSNLAFDGIEATPFWFLVIGTEPGLARALGVWWRPLIYTAGLLGVWLLFTLVFLGCMRLVLALGVTKVNSLTAISSFAFTLVPIALAYDVAHNYTYLVVQGQAFLPTLSDPLGRGWNLIPAFQNLQPSFALASPETVWLMQVVLIVIGHVIAVYLAHFRANQWFRGAYRALASQYPILALMVAYTMTSLWILAQPITAGG